MKNDKIKEILEKANKHYRTKEEGSFLSDNEYDYLHDLFDDEEFKQKVGIQVEKRKIALDIKMGSLNKVKTLAQIHKWHQSKKFSLEEECCIIPKYDGLSLLSYFENGKFIKAATRGDGLEGQDVTAHFKYTKLGKVKLENNFTGYIIGEVIFSLPTFNAKYKNEFKNARNMIAGILSRKTIDKSVYDISFIAFSVVEQNLVRSKKEELDFCNNNINWLYDYQIPYATKSLAKIQENFLEDLFKQETTYLCDGLVLCLNDYTLQQKLGFETNSLNPCFARAWKPENDNEAYSEVININWQVSKAGYQKPVLQIKPVFLSGVEISNVTAINARFVLENNIGKNSHVAIIRAGDVIPKITKILVPSKEELITNCAGCQTKLIWNKNEVELVCTNPTCTEMKIAEAQDFFKILNIEEIGEGIIRQLFNANYSLEEILFLTEEELFKLDNFKEKKASKLYNQIQSKLDNVPLEKVQHASNIFKNLGEKKLSLLNQYDNPNTKPTQEEIEQIEGFSNILAQSYLNGFDKFWQWLQTTPITIAKRKDKISDIFANKKFVFSGFRSKELEEKIIAFSGEITSSLSSKTFALIVKDKNSSSSKITKAKNLSINIYSIDEINELLS